MRFLILTGAFVLLLVPQLFGQKEAELVKAVKAKLDKINDYQATGKMKIDVAFIKAPVAAIKVFYKKPDKFKIQKQDGLSILPKGGVHVNIGSLLGGDNYSVVPAGNAEVKGIPTKVVKLLPLDENSDVVLTTMYVDEKNLLVKKATITTKENGTYDVEMEYANYASWGLPDKVNFMFHTKDYKLPKGVTLEYESGAQKIEKPKNSKGKVEIIYSSYSINKGISDAVFLSKS